MSSPDGLKRGIQTNCIAICICVPSRKEAGRCKQAKRISIRPPCFAVRTRIQVLKSEGIGCNPNKGV